MYDRRSRISPTSSRKKSCWTGRLAAGEPEVGDADATVAIDEHVVELEVAMDEAGGVRGCETATGLREDGDLSRAAARAATP